MTCLCTSNAHIQVVQTTRDSPDGHQHMDIAALKSSASGAIMRVEHSRDAVVFRAAHKSGATMLVEVSGTELH